MSFESERRRRDERAHSEVDLSSEEKDPGFRSVDLEEEYSGKIESARRGEEKRERDESTHLAAHDQTSKRNGSASSRSDRWVEGRGDDCSLVLPL